MSNGYGIEVPRGHGHAPPRKPTRYLVIIDDGDGSTLARLFLESRERVAEFDAASEETTVMTRGLVPVRGATGPEWDQALRGHSAAERAAAQVYTLDV